MSLPSLEWPGDRPLPARESGRAPRPRWKSKFEILTAENESLKAENEALKVQLARGRKNSSASSKPPSSDFVKPKAEHRQPGIRKAGGQPGPSGVKRVLLPPEALNAFRNLPLTACPDCGHAVGPAPEAPTRVQQHFELPEIPVVATPYTRPGYACAHCERIG